MRATSTPWTCSPTTTTTTAPPSTGNSATSTPRTRKCRAVGHYQQSIRHAEARGDTYGAGGTRCNIALLLAENGRADEALHYARAALANFRQVGPGAVAMAGQAEALIQELERILVARPHDARQVAIGGLPGVSVAVHVAAPPFASTATTPPAPSPQ